MYCQGQKNKINMHKKATLTEYSSMSTHLDYPGYRLNFPFPHIVLQYGYNMNDEAYKYSFQIIK